jgi:hypothetical protein
VQQTNLTNTLSITNTTFDIVYNVNIYACYNEKGCGNNFASNFEYLENPNIWQQVLILTNQVLEINTHVDIIETSAGKGLEVQRETFMSFKVKQ